MSATTFQPARVTNQRFLNFVPPPHDLLHAAHLPQAPILQLTGQLFVWHFCDFVSAGHFLPPYLAFLVTLRVVVCLPPPQVLEHFGQPAHGDTAQSIGHFFLLHTLDCESAGHLTPPFFAAT